MLTEHAIALLDPIPRHEQARKLLTGHVGPLAEGEIKGAGPALAFDDDRAGLAYLVWLARHMAGRPKGMLDARKVRSWDADATVEARVLSIARRSGDLSSFGTELFRRLGMRISELPASDLLWWRGFTTCGNPDDRWSHLRYRSTLSEVLQAAALLGDWMWRDCPVCGRRARVHDLGGLVHHAPTKSGKDRCAGSRDHNQPPTITPDEEE